MKKLGTVVASIAGIAGLAMLSLSLINSFSSLSSSSQLAFVTQSNQYGIHLEGTMGPQPYDIRTACVFGNNPSRFTLKKRGIYKVTCDEKFEQIEFDGKSYDNPSDIFITGPKKILTCIDADDTKDEKRCNVQIKIPFYKDSGGESGGEGILLNGGE